MVDGQRVRRRVPVGGVGRERASGDLVQRLFTAPVPIAVDLRQFQTGCDVLLHLAGGCPVRVVAGEQPVENAAESVHVHGVAGTPGLALQLLRGGERQRASRPQACARGDLLGQPKIGDIRGTLTVDDDVVRLDITVRDARGVDRLHALGETADQHRDLAATRPGPGLAPPV